MTGVLESHDNNKNDIEKKENKRIENANAAFKNLVDILWIDGYFRRFIAVQIYGYYNFN